MLLVLVYALLILPPKAASRATVLLVPFLRGQPLPPFPPLVVDVKKVSRSPFSKIVSSHFLNRGMDSFSLRLSPARFPSPFIASQARTSQVFFSTRRCSSSSTKLPLSRTVSPFPYRLLPFNCLFFLVAFLLTLPEHAGAQHDVQFVPFPPSEVSSHEVKLKRPSPISRTCNDPLSSSFLSIFGFIAYWRI